MGMFDSIGGIFGDVVTAFSNHREAEMNRDFQEHMRKTAYQDTVKDLQAAGLSPMLAYGKGPTGISGGAQAASAPEFGTSMMKGAQKALTEEQIEKVKAEQAAVRAQEQLNINNAKLVAEQAKKTAIEVEQMPQRFYFDLALLGSQINNNSAAAANYTANTRNTNALANLTEIGKAPSSDPTITRLVKDAKTGIVDSKNTFEQMIQDMYLNFRGKKK